MISRRSVLGGTTVGGILASLAPAEAAEADVPAAQVEQAMEGVGRAVRELRDSLREDLRRQNSFWEIAPVRNATKSFLRTAGKYPDFLEVGTDIWHQVYDWHVRFQQPLTIGRNAEGRYTLMFMGTMLIMRVEVQPNFVGIPFDNNR
jgi:hypothetical protein